MRPYIPSYSVRVARRQPEAGLPRYVPPMRPRCRIGKMCSILFHCVPLSFGLWYTVGQWGKEIGQAAWVCPIEQL